MIRKIATVGMVVLAAALTGCEKPLSITDVNPKTGNMVGGEPVEIIGTGFHSNMGISVYIGSNKVDTVSIQGENKLTVSTPVGNEEGQVDIRVVTDDGQEFLLPRVFTYVKGSASGMDIRQLGERKSMRDKPE